MTATAGPPRTTPHAPAPAATPASGLRPADGLELLGGFQGSGYKKEVALVRRGDGQVVQVGPLMYALLDCADGRRDADELAAAMSDRLGRRVEQDHLVRLVQKLGGLGLLAGTEDNAPEKSNPLLALRWRVLITDPKVTRRLTDPLTPFFRRLVVLGVLAAFLGVAWFVLVQKGVASATAEAFQKPELLLFVFLVGIASAGFHELGHAAACRYAGGTPGGIGAGLYMVWPAFYTDVTDAYRLPRRDRLRVDLGGLYFNMLVAVATLAAWLILRVDALLLIVALQLIQMVQQLSPVIRADGYHILSDLTGVPDLYQHLGPTLKRLVPWNRREPSALSGRARVLVTAWVLIVVPLLLALSLSLILVFPRLVATAWASAQALAGDIGEAGVVDTLVAVLRLIALALPVIGVGLMAQRFVRTALAKARAWSAGRPGRKVVVGLASGLIATVLFWAWWPAGQYEPVQASERGTVTDAGRALAAPAAAVRPSEQARTLSPGKHVALALIPKGGATEERPAFFVIRGDDDQERAVVMSPSAPAPSDTQAAAADPGDQSQAPAEPGATTTAEPVQGTAFPFKLPAKPGPGDNQALAVNTEDGSVKYVVAYMIVTVHDGAPVDNTNAAYAFASCTACTTVAVSFQLVLIVGSTDFIAPINFAGALNVNCPACITAAIANQIVVTLSAEPSEELLAELNRELGELDGIDELGTPEEIAAAVEEVEQDIHDDLEQSGLLPQQQAPPEGETQTTTSPEPAPTESSTTPSETTTTTTEEPSQTTTTEEPSDTSTTPSETTTAPSESDTTTTPSESDGTTSSP